MSTELKGSKWIWKDGDFIPWEDATLHLLSTAVQFGTSMFEGIRCYDSESGPAIFRLDVHLERLVQHRRAVGRYANSDFPFSGERGRALGRSRRL